MKLYFANFRCYALVVAMTATAGETELQAQASRYVGCYDVNLGSWSPGELLSDSIYYLPPARIRLTEHPARTFGQVRGNRIDTAPGAMPSIHRFSWWKVTNEVVQLTWSTGFSGFSARVSGPETLQGHGERFLDVVPSVSFTVPIELAPVDCNAHVPESRRKYYRFSPKVLFRDGAELTLDSVPSEAVASERLTDRLFLMQSEPLPPYDGTDRVEVHLNTDATVRAVHLRYPELVELAEVVSKLRTQFGEPTSVRSSPVLTMWASRLMYISASESEGRVHVRLISQRW